MTQNVPRFEASSAVDDANGLVTMLQLLNALLLMHPTAASACAPTSAAASPAEDGSASFDMLPFLLRHVAAKKYSNVKQAAADLLAAIAQANAAAHGVAIGTASVLLPSGDEVSGMEALLRAVNVYKRSNPGTAEESECLMSIFSTLYACLVCATSFPSARCH